MRAAVFYEHGAREVLKVVDDLPAPPEPAPGQARINMKAVALNRLDSWVRNGWPSLKLNMPHINCADGAGVVEAVGADVHNVAPGDRVGINPTIIDEDCIRLTGQEEDCLDIHILGETIPGVGAEQVVLPARNLIKLPDHVSFAESAAAGLVYITSWHSLVTRGDLQAGESVLIVGAGGGVNTASIQIAKLASAKVYVVGSNAAKCAQAEAFGADVTINREENEDWSKVLFKLTNKRGVDVVVDNVGQATMFGSIRSVKRGGRILVVGNTSGPMFNMDLRYLFTKQISIIGSSMGTTSDFVKVMNLVFEGKLKPVVSNVLPLSEIQEAHRLLEAGEVFGKIVLEV
jgi:NADPH:quinone reductase-like Zn-dependent oxidoreductase